MKPPRSPILPGRPTDRTGTGAIVRRALAAIDRRFSGLLRAALAIFDRIPVYSLNLDLEPRVRYGLTAEQMASVSEELAQAIQRALDGDRELGHVLWWEPFVEDAAQLGAAQSFANLSALSEAYAAARSLEAIYFSEPYRLRVATAKFRGVEYWTGLSSELRRDLATVIGQAIADGTNPKAARRLIAERLEVGKSRAALYAQTDITNVLREARMAEADDARERLGIRSGLLWASAFLPTTRPHHAARHGRAYSTEEVKAFYAERGNRFRCFLPGTLVAGRFVAGVKSRYKGAAMCLVTAGGRQLSVTANHPVLTARGMVPAAELRKGDQLVAYRANVQSPLGVRDLYGGLMGAAVEDVFGALVEAGHQSTARVSPVDLHGDAAFVEPDVDVVQTDQELVFALDTAAAQLLDQLQFVLPDASASARGDLEALFDGLRSRARGGIGRGSVGAPFFGAHLPHAISLSIAPVAQLDTGGTEQATEGRSADPVLLADGQHGLPIGVELDEVVEVVRFEYAGHVFDLQERSGLMLGSNIVVSNCHCSITEVLLDEKGRPILTDRAKKSLAGELAAWRKAQKGAP
ncbi:MAG: hypothetical protein RIS88_2781 [Pseudomonadota bacterium]